MDAIPHTQLEDIQKKRVTLQARRKMVQMAWDDLEESINNLLDEAEAKHKSIRLSKTKQAELLGLSRGHFYNLAFKTKTYADLWAEVKRRRPDLLQRLEENYNEYLKTL